MREIINQRFGHCLWLTRYRSSEVRVSADTGQAGVESGLVDPAAVTELELAGRETTLIEQASNGLVEFSVEEPAVHVWSGRSALVGELVALTDEVRQPVEFQ